MAKSTFLLYGAGVVFATLPGLVTIESRALSFGPLGLGILFFGAASWLSGVSRPVTALTLMLVTNVSFWLSYGLWRAVRPQIVQVGIDPFSAAISLWLLVFLGCALYECVVLVWGLSDRQQRQLSMIGLAGTAIQVPVTIRLIYGMIQGV